MDHAMASLGESVAALLDLPMLSQYGMRLLTGLWMTVRVVCLSVVLGFAFGTLVCRARISRNPLVSGAAAGYVTFFRGTPLLCQLYLCYYGAGEIRPFLTSLNLWWFFRDAFYCCIFAFSLNTAAYQAEIMRGALASVPKGQREAAAALGLSRWHTLRRVVAPQAFLVALRPFGNELVSMIKASALAAIVTLLDLMGQTRFVFARTFDFSVYVYAALIYLVITEAIRRVWAAMEHAASGHLRARVQVGAPAGRVVVGEGAGVSLSPAGH